MAKYCYYCVFFAYFYSIIILDKNIITHNTCTHIRTKGYSIYKRGGVDEIFKMEGGQIFWKSDRGGQNEKVVGCKIG